MIQRHGKPVAGRGRAGVALLALCLATSPVMAQVADTAAHPVPAAWHPPISNLLLGGIFVGTLAAVQFDITGGLDNGIDPSPQEDPTFLRELPEFLGRGGLYFGLSGATLLVGHLAHDRTATRLGLRTLETLAVTGVATIALKTAIGRTRPGFGREQDEFDAFTGSNSYRSLPSGHTSTAFAVATVLTLELGDSGPWIPYVTYPIATWVGVSRVMDEKHWPTDILAGAALGILSAQVWHGLRRDDGAIRRAWAPAIWSHPDGGVILGLRLPTGGGLE